MSSPPSGQPAPHAAPDETALPAPDETAPPEEDETAPPEEGSLRAKIGKVAGASAIAQIAGELIALAQVIALARLLSPHQVGLFAAGTVLTMFLCDVAEGGLRSAIVQRRTRLDDAAETAFRVSLVSGILLSLGALASAPVVALIFHEPTAGYVAAATSGSMLLYSLTNVPEAILQREFNVRRRIVVGPAMALTFGTVAVILAACGWGVWSMVAGQYASSIVLVVCLWVICDWRPGRGRFSLSLWRELARFGFPLMVMMLSFRLKQMAEAVIVGRVLGPGHLGQWRYAERIGQIPVKAIVNVGGIALFPAFSHMAGDRERSRAAYLRALQWAMIAAAPLTALMIAIGLPAVEVVLGKRWHEAGVAVVAMAGVGVSRALQSVSQEAIKAAGRTSLINWCTATEVVVGLILVVSLIKPLGLFGVGLAASITTFLVAAIYVSFATSVVGVPVRSVVRALAAPVPAAALACVVTMAVEHQVFHSASHSVFAAIGLLVADVTLFGAFYLAVLYVVEPTVVRELVAVAVRLGRRVVVRREQR